MKNIQTKITNTILHRKQAIMVGSEEYQVAPATFETLILASELISQLPNITVNKEHITTGVLMMAKDCRFVGEIAAILMLGADGLVEPRTYCFGLIKSRLSVINHKEILARKVLKLSPPQVSNLIGELLNMQEVADFFGITTSLLEINLLQRTKIEATASGQ